MLKQTSHHSESLPQENLGQAEETMDSTAKHEQELNQIIRVFGERFFRFSDMARR
jgi:hypothetical protein